MKTIVTAAVLALAAATPTLAQTQLERSLGVDAGQFTASQLVQLKTQASEDSENMRNTFFGNARINFSASNIHNDVAARIFADHKSGSSDDN